MCVLGFLFGDFLFFLGLVSGFFCVCFGFLFEFFVFSGVGFWIERRRYVSLAKQEFFLFCSFFVFLVWSWF